MGLSEKGDMHNMQACANTDLINTIRQNMHHDNHDMIVDQIYIHRRMISLLETQELNTSELKCL